MYAQMQQKIITNLKHLDSFELVEVQDFVEFINHKKRSKLPDSIAIDTIYGKYRDRVSSSQEFARRKQEEIESEEKKRKKTRWARAAGRLEFLSLLSFF